MQTIRFQPSHIEPFPLQVQGESYYRANIEEISEFLDEDDGEGVDASNFTARLILDDNNQYDPGNAVRVEIDGKLVGHLSKQNAMAYRHRLAQLGLSNAIGECRASIKGGFALPEGGFADYGVRLDLDLKAFNIASGNQRALEDTQPRVRKPAWRKFLEWFFVPGKLRLVRIILFFFLMMFLCGCWLSFIQIVTGNA